MKKKSSRSTKDLAHKAKLGDAKAAFQLYEDYRDGYYVEADELVADEYANKAMEIFQEQSFHITSLRLVNFRAFKSVDLMFSKSYQNDKKLTVLVGVNGAGKTTILDAIAYSLSWVILRILHPPNSGKGETIDIPDLHYSKDGVAEYASAVFDLQVNPNLEYQMELSKAALASNGSRKNEVEEIGRLGRLYKLANVKVPNFNMPIMAYYGVERTIGFKQKDIKKTLGDIGDSQSKFDGYEKALDANVNFVVFFQWFRYQTEVAGLEVGEPKIRAHASLKVVSEAIASVMPNLQNLRIQRLPVLDMLIDKDGLTLSVTQLSQGEKSLLSLVFDIARRLILLNPDVSKRSPLEGYGIVLIDEIDLHLHPAWQQRVVPSLTRTFPNVQFILTTHSPQVITTVPYDCIKLLDEGEVSSAPRGTRGAESSRILKRIFGVDPRPQDDENTKLLNRYLKEIYDDRWADEAVMEMRTKLNAIFAGEEPELTRADLYIENRKWELGLEEG